MPTKARSSTASSWLQLGCGRPRPSAAGAASQGVSAQRTRADNNLADILPSPFRKADFDLEQPEAKPGVPREPAKVNVADNVWAF